MFLLSLKHFGPPCSLVSDLLSSSYTLMFSFTLTTFLFLFICLGRVILRHSLWSLTATSFLLALLLFGRRSFSVTACRWRCSSTSSAPLLWCCWGRSALTRTAVQLWDNEEAMTVLWAVMTSIQVWGASMWVFTDSYWSHDPHDPWHLFIHLLYLLIYLFIWWPSEVCWCECICMSVFIYWRFACCAVLWQEAGLRHISHQKSLYFSQLSLFNQSLE